MHYVCNTMLVQRFEPQGRRFTNFHYYYYLLLLLISRDIERHEDDVNTVTENGLASQLGLCFAD